MKTEQTTTTKMSHQAQHKQSSPCPPSAATKVFSTFELLESILLYASEYETCRSMREMRKSEAETYMMIQQACKSMQLLLSVQRVCKSAYDTVKISKPLQQRLWYSSPPNHAFNPLFMIQSSPNNAPFQFIGPLHHAAKSILVGKYRAEGKHESWRKMFVLSDVHVSEVTVWNEECGWWTPMYSSKLYKPIMTGEELMVECKRMKAEGGADGDVA
ncbi:hypothetical protein AC578_4010 [Pseudocercospora eumusae]|uniref:Uncharacterized protein n=1 Tax=Pseudocercospora eumusae TaxID=321146 RepID=A0A139HLW3_9PEZI|nr:hypothetical protein AC578_4010 [Pseudocercospora eumusae]